MTTTPVSQRQQPFFPVTPPRQDKTRAPSPSDQNTDQNPDLDCIADYRALNQGLINYYQYQNREWRPYGSFKNELVLSNSDENFVVAWCAEQQENSALNNRRIVNLVRDSNNNLRTCKTRYYHIENPNIGNTNDTAIYIYESRSHKHFHAEGTYKSLRLGQIWAFDRRTKALTKHPDQVASLKNRGNLSPEQSHISTEFELMKNFVNRRGIAQCMGTCSYTSLHGQIRQMVIMPFYNQGSGSDLLNKISLEPSTRPNYPQLERMQLDLLCGLKTLHSEKKAHRDIKPANALIHLDSNGAMTGFLSDFGWARSFSSGCREEDVGACTLLYASPELMNIYQKDKDNSWFRGRDSALKETLFKPHRDIWALGVFFCRLLEEKEKPHTFINYIFKSENSNMLMSRLADLYDTMELKPLGFENFLFPEPTIETSFAHIVWEMLNPDPDKRISAEEAYIKWEACLFQQTNPKSKSSQIEQMGTAAIGQAASPSTPGSTATKISSAPQGATPTHNAQKPSAPSPKIPQEISPTAPKTTPTQNEPQPPQPIISWPAREISPAAQEATPTTPNAQKPSAPISRPPTKKTCAPINNGLAQNRSFLFIRTTSLGEPL